MKRVFEELGSTHLPAMLELDKCEGLGLSLDLYTLTVCALQCPTKSLTWITAGQHWWDTIPKQRAR